MSSNGRRLRRANPNTINNKVLVGYHGWFSCPGDGQPPQPDHHGWGSWFDTPIPGGGHPTFDLYPDVSLYPSAELYTAPGLTLPSSSSEPARLFSSRNRSTVQSHFQLLAKHGIDGVFVMRTAKELEVGGNPNSLQAGITRIRDEVIDKIREAAEQQDRVWAIMYDVSGIPNQWLPHVLRTDWGHLLRDKSIIDSPNYLREGGKPVIGISGLGLKDARHDPGLMSTILRHFRMVTPGGAYIVAGVSTNWRTPDQGDQDANPGFEKLWKEMDAIMPLSVGKYQDEYSTDSFSVEIVREDVKEIKRWNAEWNGEKRIEYIPTAFPGLSRYNLTAGATPINEIPRQSGRFLWRQIYHYQREGARTIFFATLDNFKDGTALLPSVPLSRLLPHEYRFLALDADGDTSLSPDWYLRICGIAGEAMKGEKMIVTDAMPKKEIDDYWGMRPRYEEGASNEANAGGGSGSGSGSGVASGPSAASAAIPGPSSSSASTEVSGSLRPAAGGPPMRSMTADFDGPAPPPYSLEAEEEAQPATSNPVSSQPLQEEPAAFVSSPTRQAQPLPAQPEPQPQSSGPRRTSTAPSGPGPIPGPNNASNNAPNTSFYPASVGAAGVGLGRNQSAMASFGIADQRQARPENRQQTSPASPGAYPGQQGFSRPGGARPGSGAGDRGASPLRNTSGYPAPAPFQMPPIGQAPVQSGMPNIEGLSLHGRPPSAPSSSPPADSRPSWNRNSRPTSPARYGNQSPGWSPGIEPGQIFPHHGSPLQTPPLSGPSSYPQAQIPNRQDTGALPPFRGPGDPTTQALPPGPMTPGSLGGGPFGVSTPPAGDPGGFVLPEQAPSDVGGFATPGLVRNTSARVNPLPPPPMHPQRPAVPPSRRTSGATVEPTIPPPSRVGPQGPPAGLPNAVGPEAPLSGPPSGPAGSSYPTGPTGMSFPPGPSSYGPSPSNIPSIPNNASQPQQTQAGATSESQQQSPAPVSHPGPAQAYPMSGPPGMSPPPTQLSFSQYPSGPSSHSAPFGPPSFPPSHSSQYGPPSFPPSHSSQYGPPAFPPSSWHVPHAQGLAHGIQGLFHHGQQGASGYSNPTQSYSQYPGQPNTSPQASGSSYPPTGPSASVYPQMPPNQVQSYSPALPSRPGHNVNQLPANMPTPNLLGPASQYLDKFAGEERRIQLEKGLGATYQTGTKLWNKFSGGGGSGKN